MKVRILAAEGGILVVLAAANTLTGRFLAAAILLGVGGLALACAWALRPAGRELPTTPAGESPRRAGSNPPPRH